MDYFDDIKNYNTSIDLQMYWLYVSLQYSDTILKTSTAVQY